MPVGPPRLDTSGHTPVQGPASPLLLLLLPLLFPLLPPLLPPELDAVASAPLLPLLLLPELDAAAPPPELLPEPELEEVEPEPELEVTPDVLPLLEPPEPEATELEELPELVPPPEVEEPPELLPAAASGSSTQTSLMHVRPSLQVPSALQASRSPPVPALEPPPPPLLQALPSAIATVTGTSAAMPADALFIVTYPRRERLRPYESSGQLAGGAADPRPPCADDIEGDFPRADHGTVAICCPSVERSEVAS